jgi:methylated-DNA-[protein]-cysteine S-methyltransferase
MEEAYLIYYSTPIGLLEITGSEEAVLSALFVETKNKPVSATIPNCLKECQLQLDEYFKGKRKTFDVPVLFTGTQFQKQVWSELTTIPYGRLTTYGALARKLNTPNSVRAIGNTNSKNKLCILLPCHRVVGQDGALVGYAGGLWRKQWLIEHEQGYAGYQQLKLF